MDAPLVDETANFFLRDTHLRLTRLIEIACGYWGFVLLLYCRILAPGGSDSWSWFELGPLWALVFAPLFLLDWRNYLHWKYLHANREYFSHHDGRRYLLICISEGIFKFLLCLYLMFKGIRPYLTFKVVMLPYAVGYVLHFVLGHFVPLEDDADRAEGCNMVSAVLSDLVRFLGFILLISMSLKLESHTQTMYDWQAAFWPCWGLEGVILLVTALLLPICLASICADRPRVMLLSWIIISAVCFGMASFVSVYNMVKVLDDQLCPELPCSLSTSTADCSDCRDRLELVFWPWLVFLPAFAGGTMLFRRRVASLLHEAWYQPARPGAEAGAPPYNPSTPRPGLPPPPLLFRVTATYYSRTCEAALLDSERPEAGLVPDRLATFASTHSLRGMSLDPSTSILSARGATFTDIVESEQLCFICYSEAPDTVLLECGHAGICAACALHLLERRPGAQCPICRSVVAMVVRLRADLPVPAGLFQRERQLLEETASAAAGGQDPEAAIQGPPWPSTAKRCAVVVELVHSQSRTDFRWWRS